MKKSGSRNGLRKYEGVKTYRRGSESWNRQGGNDDKKANDQRDRLSVRQDVVGNAVEGEERSTYREPDRKRKGTTVSF